MLPRLAHALRDFGRKPSPLLHSISADVFDAILLTILVIMAMFTAPFMTTQDTVVFDYRSDYLTWVPDMMVALAPMVLVMALFLVGRREVRLQPRLSLSQIVSILFTLVASTALGGLAFVWLMHLELINGEWMHWNERWDYLHYGIGQLVLGVGFYISVRITKSTRPFFRPDSHSPVVALAA